MGDEGLPTSAGFSLLYLLQVKPPRGKPQGILTWMAELSIAFFPPSLKPRGALLAISVGSKLLAKADHRHSKPWGILAKESNQ
jgi:hypothetical protein